MRVNKNCFLIACVLVFLLNASARADDSPDELYFGSVAMDIPAEMQKRLRPLMDYLTKTLRRPVTLKLSSNLLNAAEAVGKGAVHVAYLTPVAYLKAKRAGNVRLVVKTVTRGSSNFRLVVAVRQNSPIRAIRDLAGKSFAFGDPAAVLQRAVVVDAGMGLEELASYRFIGHYDNIARGILAGDFDAGVLKDTAMYQWEKKGLRALHVSPELPPYNIAVSGRVDNTTFLAIREALLALDGRNPAHAAVIKSLDPTYDGFTVAHDAEYDVVRRMVRPFEKDG